MKKSILILTTATAMLTMVGCGNSDSNAGGEKVTYSKTAQEVYTQSCYKCHGDKAQGLTEKKTPAMNDRQAGELELDLYDVKNDGTNQSSGTEHDKMAHNMKKLFEKGFAYDPKEMAIYIEKNFYINPNKKK